MGYERMGRKTLNGSKQTLWVEKGSILVECDVDLCKEAKERVESFSTNLLDG